MQVQITQFARCNPPTHYEEQVTLRVFTNRSFAPHTAIVENPARPQAPITLPSLKNYDFLVIEVDVTTEDEDKVPVLIHLGYACLDRSAFLSRDNWWEADVTLLSDVTKHEVGVLTIRVTVAPSNTNAVPFPFSKDTQAQCEAYKKVGDAWWSNLAPLDKEVKNTHLQGLPGKCPFFPSQWFSFSTTAAPEDERVVLAALNCAASRRGIDAAALAKTAAQANAWLGAPRLGKKPIKAHPSVVLMAYIAGESGQLITNFLSYCEDTNVDGDTKMTIDEFSSDARVLGDGDCEDLAKNIVMFLDSIRSGPIGSKSNWASPVAFAAQQVLRLYVPLLILGAVKLDYVSAAYSVGKDCVCSAHAWIMLLPCAATNLDASVELDAASRADTQVPTLTLDGVQLDIPDAENTSGDAELLIPPELQGGLLDRLKRTRVIGGAKHDWKHYYQFITTGFCIGGLRYRGTQELVPQVFFCQNKGGQKYFGATYAQAHEAKHAFVVAPTMPETPGYEATGRELVRVFQPVPPYSPYTSDTARLDKFMALVKPLVDNGSRHPSVTPVYVSGEDIEQPKFVELLTNMLKKVTLTGVTAEKVAATAYGAVLYVSPRA